MQAQQPPRPPWPHPTVVRVYTIAGELVAVWCFASSTLSSALYDRAADSFCIPRHRFNFATRGWTLSRLGGSLPTFDQYPNYPLGWCLDFCTPVDLTIILLSLDPADTPHERSWRPVRRWRLLALHLCRHRGVGTGFRASISLGTEDWESRRVVRRLGGR